MNTETENQIIEPKTKTTKTGKSQAMKANTHPHPLALALSDLTAAAEALAAAVAAQSSRNANLATVRTAESETLADVAAEKIDYRAGAAALAENRGKQDAVEHLVGIRAGELTGNANKILSDAVQFKSDLLAALSATAGAILLARQAEVGSLLASWNGTSSAPSAPCPAVSIAAACPKIAALDTHRQHLEKWQFLDGFRVLAKITGAALAELGRHPIPDAAEPLRGGYSEQNRAQIVGWRGAERRLEVVADFANSAEAAAAFAEIRARSGYLGFADVSLFDGAAPRNRVHFPNENSVQLDLHQSRELTGAADFDGKSAAFLTRLGDWPA